MKKIGIFTHDLYPFKPWGQGRYVFDIERYLSNIYQGSIFVFSPSDDIRNKNPVGIPYDETKLEEYLAERSPILLTDDYAPTDILVAPLFRKMFTRS